MTFFLDEIQNVPGWESFVRRLLDSEQIDLFILERRGADVHYVRTPSGYEVDFHAQLPDRSTWLLQVCTAVEEPATLAREVRALAEAATHYPAATPLLLTLESLPAAVTLPPNLRWQPAAAWLLGDALEGEL